MPTKAQYKALLKPLKAYHQTNLSGLTKPELHSVLVKMMKQDINGLPGDPHGNSRPDHPRQALRDLTIPSAYGGSAVRAFSNMPQGQLHQLLLDMKAPGFGGSFFGDLWSGIKKGAELVSKPLQYLSYVPGIGQAVFAPIKAVTDTIKGGCAYCKGKCRGGCKYCGGACGSGARRSGSGRSGGIRSGGNKMKAGGTIRSQLEMPLPKYTKELFKVASLSGGVNMARYPLQAGGKKKTSGAIRIHLRKDLLKPFGYSKVKSLSLKQRHSALDRAVASGIDPLALFRRLNALMVFNKANPVYHKIFMDDRNYIKNNYPI